jgi:hypothetical protein
MAMFGRQRGVGGVQYGVADAALAVAAALAITAAVLVAGGVLPDVQEIWVPQTRGAGGSTPAFWASVIANLVFAAVMLATVAGRRLRSRPWRWLVVVLGVGALAQALMYLDASAAFHGPLEAAMQPARHRLRYAVAADAVAGTVAIVSVVWVAIRSGRASGAKRPASPPLPPVRPS